MQLVRSILIFCILTGARPIHSAFAQDQLDGIEELGRYMQTVRGTQQIVYRMLDYCTRELPERREEIASAKELWDNRNLVIVNSSKEVARAWFTAAGIASDEIPELLAVLESSLVIAAETVRPWEGAVAALAAKVPEERMKACGFYTGFVRGGGQDIRVLSPKAIGFYEMYAPHDP